LLRIRKTSASPEISSFSIPPGTLLRSGVAGEQDMVIAGVKGRTAGAGKYYRESQIRLTGLNEQEYVLVAYCADFDKKNPSSGNKMAIQGLDARAACVIEEGRKRSLSTQAKQAAMWITRERVPFDRMRVSFPLSQDYYNQAEAVARSCETEHTTSLWLPNTLLSP
jgi:hypothetical protein